MRRYLRILLPSILFIPFAATCGGTEPSEPTPTGLTAGPVQSAVADRAIFTTVPSVRLVDAKGSPVEQEGVAVTVAVGPGLMTLKGPTVALTDEEGIARFEGLGIKGKTGNNFLTFSAAELSPVQSAIFALVAGKPATFTLFDAPDSLSVGAGAATARIMLRDSSDNAVPDVAVAFEVLAGGGQVVGGTSTMHDGQAPLTPWRMGQVPGPNRVRITVPSAATLAPVEVEIRAHVGVPRRLSWVWDLPDSLRIDTTYLAPLRVVVADTFGNPTPGRTVVFYQPFGASFGSEVTDSLGVAVLDSFKVGTVAGSLPFRTTISPSVVQSPALDTVFYLRPGPAAAIASPWVPFADRIPGAVRPGEVSVVDAHGNPRPGEPLSIRVAEGGGSVTPAGGISNAAGKVSFNWTLGTTGRQRLEVTSSAVPDDTLLLSGVVSNPVDLQVLAGDGQVGVVGSSIPTAMVFRAVDSAGDGAPGVPLSLLLNGAPWTTLTTDSAGIHVLSGQFFRTIAGPWTISVVSPWVPADTAVVHLTSLAGPGHHFNGPDEVSGVEVGIPTDSLPRYRLYDAYNNPVGNAWAKFTSTGGSFAVDSAYVDADGWVQPPRWTPPTTSGITLVAVRLPPPNESPWEETNVRVRAGPIDSLVLVPGRAATGFAGSPIAVAPRIRGFDRYGNPSTLRPFLVAVTQGGGTILSSGVLDGGPLLDGEGYARIDGWNLGAVGPNAVRVYTDSAEVHLSADAVPPSPFSIVLRNVVPAWRPVFREAAFDWSRRLTADVPDVTVTLAAGQCSAYQSAFSGTVDDLVIDVAVTPIDGPGGILGGAGPCVMRSTGGLPSLGVMIFDVTDIVELAADGNLDDVVLHEMGHVLGIGTIWSDKGLLTGVGGNDPQYIGANGKFGWSEIGGGVLGTLNVPVENTGGQGTANSHWRESVMPSELMTGYLSAAVNPLSRVTLRSLVDRGYSVDITTADPYTVMTAPPAVPGVAPVRIREQMVRPRWTVDDDGTLRPID